MEQGEIADTWVGRVIDDCYRIDRRLGEGSYGEVYRAQDVRLNRPVAIKRLKADKCSPRELERFLDEARNLARLDHPNVVRVYRLGEFEGKHYIVMELLDGDTLSHLIRTGGLKLRDRLEVMRQVAVGLGALHSISMLHRDLAPKNIMVSGAGVAKLLDFGFSRDTRVSSTESANVIKGTLPYCSPEQVAGVPSTAASEIFSFGSILYEMLCGESPFEAELITSLIYNIGHREPEPIEERLADCPRPLADLVRACLAKRPADRPDSIAEVERRLHRVLAETRLEGVVPPAASEPVRRPSTTSNPYLQRVMLKRREDFFGRRTEVQRIFARLNATPPGSISIVGDRRIGKSSLLNYVYMPQQRQKLLEEPENMVMVFLDLSAEKNMSVAAFVDLVLGLANLELRGRLDVSDCARSLDGIKDMVQRFEAAGIRMALVLDEFEAVTTNPNFDFDFFSFLRYLANHFNVAYLTSSARNLQVLCHTKEISASPFFNIFSTMRLSAFQRAEAEELIRVPSARVGKPLAAWTEQILAMSGLFPFFIQMACAHTLEYMDERPGEAPDFREIHRRFYEEARLHYQYLWDSFDEPERSAVRRLVNGRSVPDALRHVVDELGSRRYVTDEGKPALFAAPFAEFVRALEDRAHHGSWLGRLFGKSGSGR